MPTSSLGSIARLLNRNSIKTMAAVLSIQPPVSARRLLERAPFNLLPGWEVVTQQGISKDLPNSVWHAGHVEDAYSIDGHRILLASQTGGVWLASADAQFAPIPLSNSWQQVDISCLGAGARGHKHVYAWGQGSALYETATNSLRAVANFEGLKSVKAIASRLHQGAPISLRRLLEIDSDAALFDWRQINLPLSVIIKQLVVVTGVGPAKLVLATSGGLYWSDVPDLGGTYRFSLAVGIPVAECLAVALAARTPGQNTSVVCSPTGAVSSPQSNGLYVGTWQADQLVMQRAQHFGDVDFVQWRFAVVASCDSDRSRLYAAISASGTATLSLRRALGKAGLVQPDLSAGKLAQKLGVSPAGSLDKLLRTADPQKFEDHLYAVLSSRDGGATWAPAGPRQIVEESARPDTGTSQGDYNMSIAVSPADPNMIALGWRGGPWIGRNTAQELTWEQHGDNKNEPGFSPHIHADSHGLHFDPHDPSGKTLLVCSDGGFIFTRDLCRTFDSSINGLLPNLQFGGSPGAAGVSMLTPRLLSGPLQDNGVVFSAVTGGAQSPWKRITVEDDGLFGIMLQNDTVLFSNNDDPTPRTAKWNGAGFDAEVKLPVRTASPSIPAGAFLPSPFFELVLHPAFLRPGSRQLMYAIATCDSKSTWDSRLRARTASELWGLFADADGGNAGWDFLVKLGANGTAAASDDGNTVLIGMDNGGIFAYNSRTGKLSKMALDPSITKPAGQVYQFSYLNSGVAIARFQSTLLRLDPATGQWTTMGGNGMPLNEGDMHFTAVDTGRSPPILYLATDFGVHATWDAGANWLPVSQGLPLHSHPSTLRTTTDPDGSRRLYLFTFGRSAWHAQLN